MGNEGNFGFRAKIKKSFVFFLTTFKNLREGLINLHQSIRADNERADLCILMKNSKHRLSDRKLSSTLLCILMVFLHRDHYH